MNTTLAAGTVHKKVPGDLAKVVLGDKKAHIAWDDITPLARNEWICLIEDAKLPETRTRRIERARSQLAKGQRRPCCWTGCPHREKNGK
jgi:uncharacterized protein YdeI (YjbR/CyaY-like superfamily)